jgi:flagellar biogenesis protein FliO
MKKKIYLSISLAMMLFGAPLIGSSQELPKKEETAPTGPQSPAAPHQEEPPFSFPPESSTVKPLPHSYEGALVKMIATVIGLGAFVALTVWVLRKLGQGRFRGFGSSRSIQVIERKPLSPKSMLYLVEIGHQKFLIAESQLEVRQIGIIEELSETVADETK